MLRNLRKKKKRKKERRKKDFKKEIGLFNRRSRAYGAIFMVKWSTVENYFNVKSLK